MREVDSTGALKAGEKALAELRKRKLVVQRYVTISADSSCVSEHTPLSQEGPVVHRTQGPELQHLNSKARNRSHGRHAHIVGPLRSFLWRMPHMDVPRGSWKTATYKKYNFEADGIPPLGGALHPLLKVREEIRNIFLEMGYALVEPSKRHCV